MTDTARRAAEAVAPAAAAPPARIDSPAGATSPWCR